MKKNNTDSQLLRKYLLKLPVEEFSKMIRKMAEECMVPLSTFNNWQYGVCRIPDLAKHKIEEIAGQKIFNATEP